MTLRGLFAVIVGAITGIASCSIGTDTTPGIGSATDEDDGTSPTSTDEERATCIRVEFQSVYKDGISESTANRGGITRTTQ